ncbi:hypothetical protein GCM10007385_39650 [Tateyamaria omphalii]|uniref:glycosyltransferase family 2 protein n=1 Tax=Tateyamaria omphalii TaxID=299262 RepID=UPI0019AFCCC5|nr:glycosyltransferase [Tateyamaria omphalii]GGX66668.1 hypothetical protein GCM10007385_39650 [Tateyamaria omphalii]
MTDGRVTVLMTHYGSGEYLADALRSLLERQTCPDFHLILVDDASPGHDWHAAIAPWRSDPRLRLYRSDRNVGTYRLLNRCLAMVETEFVSIHDADDVSAPERLERQLAYLDRHQSVGVVGCSYYEINATGFLGRRVNMPRNVNLAERLGKKFTILHPTVMARRSVYEALGGYDGTRRCAADQDFFMRAIRYGPVRNLAEPMFFYRRHEAAMTSSPTIGLGSETRRTYAEDIARRRVLARQGTQQTAALRAPQNDIDFAFLPL